MISVGTAAHTCRALARSSSGVDVEPRAEALAVAEQRHRAAQLVHERAARGGDRRAAARARRRGRSRSGRISRGERLALGRVTAGGPRTAGTRRPRASACRPARRPSTGGSGRSPRARGRRRPSSRRRSRPRGPAAPRSGPGGRPAGSGRPASGRASTRCRPGRRPRRPGCGGSRASARVANASCTDSVGLDAVGVGGHPLGHLEAGGRRAGRGQAHEVALGEDADRPVAVDDDDRADACGRACGRRPRRRSRRAVRSPPASS